MHRLPRSIRTPRAAVFLLAAAVAACGDSAGSEMLPPGRYLYTASHPTPQAGDSIRLEGVLEIGEDGDGAWEVPQLHPEMEVRSADEGVVLVAHPTYFGTIEHWIDPSGGGIRCRGEYSWIADGGVERSLPLICSLSTEVPEGYAPAVPTISTPAVRPADVPPSAPQP